MSYGDDDPTSADSISQVRPDGRVRQPDPGSVSTIAAYPAEDGGRKSGHDRERLEANGSGLGRGDDQHRADLQRAEPDGQAAVLEALQVQLEQRQWSGPLPPPATLYQYEQVQPGLAERIVAMAETATTGEIKTREKLASAEIDQARVGQSLAFLLTIIALGAAIYFFVVHNATAGGLLLSFPVIMLIRSFLTGLRGDGGKPDDDAREAGES